LLPGKLLAHGLRQTQKKSHGGDDHAEVIGLAEQGNDVGHDIHGHEQIDERADDHGFGRERRFVMEKRLPSDGRFLA
jgi:hypothetical protein